MGIEQLLFLALVFVVGFFGWFALGETVVVPILAKAIGESEEEDRLHGAGT